MRALFMIGISGAACLALLGCGGNNDASIFSKPGAPPDPPPSASNPPGDLVDSGALVPETSTTVTVCAPQALDGFTPAWTPPESWKQKVCTAQQISGFYAACLTPPITAATCGAFVQANGSCATCLQSQDTAAETAAVVWHQADAYWTVNVAGCLARATGDPSGKGCGGAYAAAIACRQQSCSACWAAQGNGATFAEFSSCESQAGGSTCTPYAEAVPAACGDLSSGPASQCMPPSGATAEEAFLVVAPLFCGG